MDEQKFEPQGYCPKCNYQMNPGVCSECGMTVTSSALLASPMTQYQRAGTSLAQHRKLIAFLLLGSIVTILASILWPSCSSSCVVQGSLVATPQGPKIIDGLRVGDSIYCESPSGASVVGTITAIQTGHASEYREFFFSGKSETLRVTASHPIATSASWEDARNVHVGDLVSTDSGFRKVTQVQRRLHHVNVYDLSVAPFPNFFANGVLVHNKSKWIPPTVSAMVGVWVGITHDDMCLYRIDLHGDGTGSCAYVWERRYAQDEAVVHQITDWTINGLDIEITIDPGNKPNSSPLTYMKGRVWRSRSMVVEVGGKGGYFTEKLSLIREEEALEGIRLARDAMTNGFEKAKASE